MTQREERTSLLNLHRRLIALRRTHPALAVGSYQPILATGDLLLYARECDGERLLVVLNLGSKPAVATFTPGALSGRLLLSTFCDREFEAVRDDIALRADEGVIVELSKEPTLALTG